MARLHSSLGDRTVYTAAGMAKAQGYAAKVYEDPAGTVLANLAVYDPTNAAVPGAAIPGAALVVDPWSNRPAFWDLNDREALYISVAGPTGLPGPLEPIRPDAQPLVTALATRVGTVEGVAAAAETPAGAQAKADAAAAASAAALAASRSLLNVGTKRAAFVLGQTGGNTPHASFGVGSPGITMRHPVRLPCATSRWRLHIRNYDARDDISYSGLITFSGAYVGTAVLDSSGAFNGVFTAGPVQALTGTTFEGATEWVSGWVTATAAQFQANTKHLLSSGVEVASGGQTSRGYGGIYWIGDKTSAGAVSAAPPMTSTNVSALDMWIEYETEGDYPVGLYIGDSLTLGRRATADVGMLGSWPVAHGHRTRSLAINAGLSGAQASTWLTTTQYKWTKWGLGSSINPDYAVVGIGSNDIAGAVALATVQANFGSLVSILRGFGIDRVYAVTVPPRSLAGAQETDRVNYNKWLESLPYAIDGCFRADVPVTASGSPSVLDTAVDSGDLIHMTTAGYQRVAAALPGRLA